MEIPYINQLSLEKKGVKKNKVFLKKIYSCKELSEVKKWFDKLDCSVSFARQTDEKMTLEKFINEMNENFFHGTLQINSPYPLKIRYCLSFGGGDRVSRFAWVIYRFNDHNFKLTSEIYEKSFGSKIQDDPLPEEFLKAYQEQFRDLTSRKGFSEI